MTNEEIAEIRARCEAAIPGPWEAKKLGYNGQQINIYQGPVKKVNGGISYIGAICNMEDAEISDYSKKQLWNTAKFIANARQDIPSLLDALETKTKRVDELEININNYKAMLDRCERDIGQQVITSRINIQTERDYWKTRAEALERAIVAGDVCGVCVKEDICDDGACYDYHEFQFDKSKFNGCT